MAALTLQHMQRARFSETKTRSVSALYSNLKRLWFQNEAQIKITWVTWFDNVTALWRENVEMLHHGGGEDEESLSGEVFPQARPSSTAERDQAASK